MKMKLSVIYTCILFVIISKVNAQIEKGNWSLGISTNFVGIGDNSILGFGYTVNEDDGGGNKTKSFQFNLAPRIGYILRKDFIAGLDFNVSYQDSRNTISTFVGAGPFVRYYLKGNLLRPYVEIQGNYGNLSIKSEGSFFGDQDFNVRYIFTGGSFGLAFPIKNIVHIDLATAFNYQFGKFIEGDFKDNGYSIGLKVGVTVFFDKSNAIKE